MSGVSLRALAACISNIMPKFYYAVAKGRKTGIFQTWDECKQQVLQYPKSIYKKFPTLEEAEKFVQDPSFLKKEKSIENVLLAPTTLESFEAANAIPLGGKSLRTAPFKASLNAKRNYSAESHESSPQPSKKAKISTDDNKKPCDEFIIDSDGYVNVYTDGACSMNGMTKARAGIGVWFNNNHPLNVSQPVDGRASNNTAEIQAVTVAILQAKKAGVIKLKVITDSQFLINCITKWVPKWKRNGWLTRDGKPVKNKVELIEMDKAIKSLDVIWHHVNGHIGLHGNEMADQLAKAGALRY